MNAGRAITRSLQDQRKRDLWRWERERLLNEISRHNAEVFADKMRVQLTRPRLRLVR